MPGTGFFQATRLFGDIAAVIKSDNVAPSLAILSQYL